jgi:hypothetical protein
MSPDLQRSIICLHIKGGIIAPVGPMPCPGLALSFSLLGRNDSYSAGFSSAFPDSIIFS